MKPTVLIRRNLQNCGENVLTSLWVKQAWKMAAISFKEWLDKEKCNNLINFLKGGIYF